MSTSADRASTDTDTTRRAGTPIYKRRRRQIYGATGVIVVLVIALIVWAVTQGGGSGQAALPSFTVSVGQGSIATADGIIFSQPSLEKTIPAHLHMVPFDAGVTAIAEMRVGSTLHDPTSRLVKAYELTAQFLIGQGRLTTVPSAAQIASHVNISFVQKALAGGCPS